MTSDRLKRKILLLTPLLLLVAACATTHDRLLDMDTSQVQLRSIQSRVFDTTDKEKTMRAIIATLQDLGFMLDRADYTLGVVAASKARADVDADAGGSPAGDRDGPAAGRKAAPGEGECRIHEGARHGAKALSEFLQLPREGDVSRSPPGRLTKSGPLANVKRAEPLPVLPFL